MQAADLSTAPQSICAVIERKIQVLPVEQQQQVLDFVDFLIKKHDLAEQQPSSPSIWERINTITRQVPDEVWEQIPIDGAEQHDHYLYGTPKKES